MRWIYVAVAGLLSSCASQPQAQSAESKLLQDQVVPEMIRWSKGSSPVMRLFEIPATKPFDYICYVGEYEPHSKVNSAQVPIREYRGDIGDAHHIFGPFATMAPAPDRQVPENRTAIVGVRDGIAHVAYLNAMSLRIHGMDRCLKADAAVLLRRSNPGKQYQTAVLGQLGA